MTETSTPFTEINHATSTERIHAKNDAFEFATPSQKSIQAILNFSKNLEVHSSQFVTHIVTIKS